jgi:hypothetical protein
MCSAPRIRLFDWTALALVGVLGLLLGGVLGYCGGVVDIAAAIDAAYLCELRK